MPLLISDANILIDMECGGLLQATLKIAAGSKTALQSEEHTLCRSPFGAGLREFHSPRYNCQRRYHYEAEFHGSNKTGWFLVDWLG